MNEGMNTTEAPYVRWEEHDFHSAVVKHAEIVKLDFTATSNLTN